MWTGVTPTGCRRSSALIKKVRERDKMKTGGGRTGDWDIIGSAKCSGRYLKFTGKTFYTQAYGSMWSQVVNHKPSKTRQTRSDSHSREEQLNNHRMMLMELWATLLGKITCVMFIALNYQNHNVEFSRDHLRSVSLTSPTWLNTSSLRFEQKDSWKSLQLQQAT